MNKRNGHWFTTYSGNKFFPLDARPEEVKIEDIAHALSLICRYGGHARQFYSVSQHSRHVAELLAKTHGDDTLTLQGLIHDATEAYLGDMVRPLKLSMPEYCSIEERLDAVIHEALEVPYPCFEDRAIIKWADNTLLMTERRELVNHSNFEWNIKEKPLDDLKIIPESPAGAKSNFTELWNQLKIS